MSTAVDLPAVCPRSPGFWSNWPEVWDADLSNDDRFSGHSNFPESDILLPPYYENYTAGVCVTIEIRAQTRAQKPQLWLQTKLKRVYQGCDPKCADT